MTKAVVALCFHIFWESVTSRIFVQVYFLWIFTSSSGEKCTWAVWAMKELFVKMAALECKFRHTWAFRRFWTGSCSCSAKSHQFERGCGIPKPLHALCANVMPLRSSPWICSRPLFFWFHCFQIVYKSSLDLQIVWNLGLPPSAADLSIPNGTKDTIAKW